MPGYPLRVLTYGADEVLLDTRAKLLALLHLEADTASTARELPNMLFGKTSAYALIILCHTVSQSDRHTINLAAADREIPIYQIEAFVTPVAFLAQVSSILPTI